MKKLLSLALALCLVLSLVSFASAEESSVYRFDKPLTLKVSVFDRGTPGNSPANDNYPLDSVKLRRSPQHPD